MHCTSFFKIFIHCILMILFSLPQLLQRFPLIFVVFYSLKNKTKQKCVHMLSLALSLTHTQICLHMRTPTPLRHTVTHNFRKANKTKTPPSPFYVGQLLLRFRLALECGSYGHITSVRKSNFPIPISDHLQIPSCLGVEICGCFPFFVLGFCLA